MNKKMIMRIATIIISVIIVAASFSGVFGVFAESVYPGTETEGVTTDSGGEGTMDGFGPEDYFTFNRGFEDGLKYWGTTAQKSEGQETINATATGSLKTETNGNKYWQFDAEREGTWGGIKTPKLAIAPDKLAVGETIGIMVKYQGDANIQIKSYQINTKEGEGFEIRCDVKNGTVVHPATLNDPWITAVLDQYWNGQNTIVESTYAGDGANIAAGSYIFSITAAVPGEQYSDTCLDDISFVKIKDGKYYDLATENEITFPTVATTDDLSYGTPETGYKSQQWANHATAPFMDQPRNLDFSEGFRYWSGLGENMIYPTQMAEIVTEGENKYMKFKTTQAWKGIISAAMKTDGLKDGDKLALVFDWKGDSIADSVQIYVNQVRMDANGDYQLPRVAQGTLENYITIGDTAADWNTSYVFSNSGDTIVTPEGTDKQITLQIALESKEDEEIDIAIDNIKFGILSADGKKITALDGLTVLYDADAPEGGNGGTGTGSSNGSSTTTGDSFPVMPLAVAAIMAAGSILVLRKKVR